MNTSDKIDQYLFENFIDDKKEEKLETFKTEQIADGIGLIDDSLKDYMDKLKEEEYNKGIELFDDLKAEHRNELILDMIKPNSQEKLA